MPAQTYRLEKDDRELERVAESERAHFEYSL